MQSLIASFGSIQLSTDDFKQDSESHNQLKLPFCMDATNDIKDEFVDMVSNSPKRKNKNQYVCPTTVDLFQLKKLEMNSRVDINVGISQLDIRKNKSMGMSMPIVCEPFEFRTSPK